MNNKTQKIVLASALATGIAAVVGCVSAVSHTITKKLMQIALDREQPKMPQKAQSSMMGNMNIDLSAVIDGNRAAMEKLQNSGAIAVDSWIDEGSYPYGSDDDGGTKERKRFNSLAFELSERLDAFRDLSSADRRIIFGLLRHAMADVKKGTLKEFLK